MLVQNESTAVCQGGMSSRVIPGIVSVPKTLYSEMLEQSAYMQSTGRLSMVGSRNLNGCYECKVSKNTSVYYELHTCLFKVKVHR
ncbi:hypothetical protein BVRB_8g197320 isoform A [Beta vulgaris subsp. vulgaris]|nr:hypothetical protein BVRB_8g197320 isoform A [Beta vulgaris subsp. vulgaris]